MKVLKIYGLANGGPTPFDGQYLVEYDPTRDGVDPNGDPMSAHLVTTPDVGKALKFQTAAEAMALWRKEHGIRPDGLPNRPLTAFTVEVLPAWEGI